MTEERQKEVMGIHIDLEEPKCSDLIWENAGEKTLQEQAELIMQMP